MRLAKPLKAPVTILHLSDPHFTGRRFFLSRFFDRFARLEPDFVFLTGDFIDTPSGIQPCVENIKKLKAKRGVYAVLGNHDYESYPSWRQIFRVFTRESVGARRPGETETLKEALKGVGVRVLFNENLLLEFPGGEKGVLVGIDDPFTGRADFSKAFKGIPENQYFYFVHSFYVAPADSKITAGETDYGVTFTSAVSSGHIHGCQFHPEKSHEFGQTVLKNFLNNEHDCHTGH